jgi:hypothetical protein
MVPEDIDRAETIGLDILKMAIEAYAQTNPIAALALPILEFAIRDYMAKLHADVANGLIIGDGRGGFVTKAWADDPRHALNPDGTFKF